MKAKLIDRATESIINYRKNDHYFRDTFCKFSQQLASSRAWKEAQEAQQLCDKELQDIHEWASKLQPGWERQILQFCSQRADKEMQREMELQKEEQSKIQKENEKKMKERMEKRKQEVEKKLEEKAKVAEAALLSEVEDEENKKSKKKNVSKKG